MGERIIERPRQTATHAPLRLSVASKWSVAIAILLAIGQFPLLLLSLSGHTNLPLMTAPIVIFSPFVTFFLMAGVVHYRVFTFDRDAGTLSIQGKIFLVPLKRVVVVPLSHITSAEFIDQCSSEGPPSGLVRIGIAGMKQYDVGSWDDRWAAYDYFVGVLPRNVIGMLRPANARNAGRYANLG
jgi:membrane protein YdbS with pleckstrin-like domain